MHMDRLLALDVFRRVVEIGSFSKAAEQLWLSNAAVSKHVRALEKHLGVELLARTTRSMELTEVGRSFYERCVRILDDVNEAEQLAAEQQSAPRGRIRVRATLSLGAARLGQAISAFLARYPDVTVDLSLSDRFTDPADEAFDVALLIVNALPDSGYAARPIVALERVVCAAPAYIARAGRPATPEALAGHNCILYTRGERAGDWAFDAGDGEHPVRVKGNYLCNSGMLLREALLEGIGIALIPAFLVASDIAAGKLEVLLPGCQAKPRTLYAVYPHHRHLSAKLRLFVDSVAESFGSAERWQLASTKAPSR
jgi:DNA-binding transcriptional LysR family regulator